MLGKGLAQIGIAHSTSIAFSPRNRDILASAFGHTLHIWNVHTGDLLYELGGHKYGIACLTYSPCGEVLVSGSDDTVQMRNMSDPHQATKLPIGGTCVEFTDRGRRLAVGPSVPGRPIQVWRVTPSVELQSLVEAGSEMVGFAWAHRSSTLAASYHSDEKVRIHELDGPSRASNIEDASPPPVRADQLRFSQNSREFCSSLYHQKTRTSTVQLWAWSIQAGDDLSLVTEYEASDFVEHMAFMNKNHRHVAMVVGRISVQIWDLAVPVQLWKLEYQGYDSLFLEALAVSPDDTTLAVACIKDTYFTGSGGQIDVWSIETKQKTRTLHAPQLSFGVGYMFYSPSGDVLHTDVGNVSLETPSPSHSDSLVPNAEGILKATSPWILKDGLETLWFPVRYRPDWIAFTPVRGVYQSDRHDNKIAWIYETNKVNTLEFA